MDVAMFTKNNCDWCVRVKRVFKDLGIEFREYNIDESLNALSIASACHFKTMPQVKIDQQLIGGYEATIAHLSNLGYTIKLE